jgi:hypothetical protein
MDGKVWLLEEIDEPNIYSADELVFFRQQKPVCAYTWEPVIVACPGLKQLLGSWRGTLVIATVAVLL